MEKSRRMIQPDECVLARDSRPSLPASNRFRSKELSFFPPLSIRMRALFSPLCRRKNAFVNTLPGRPKAALFLYNK